MTISVVRWCQYAQLVGNISHQAEKAQLVVDSTRECHGSSSPGPHTCMDTRLKLETIQATDRQKVLKDGNIWLSLALLD